MACLDALGENHLLLARERFGARHLAQEQVHGIGALAERRRVEVSLNRRGRHEQRIRLLPALQQCLLSACRSCVVLGQQLVRRRYVLDLLPSGRLIVRNASSDILRYGQVELARHARVEIRLVQHPTPDKPVHLSTDSCAALLPPSGATRRLPCAATAGPQAAGTRVKPGPLGRRAVPAHDSDVGSATRADYPFRNTSVMLRETHQPHFEHVQRPRFSRAGSTR